MSVRRATLCVFCASAGVCVMLLFLVAIGSSWQTPTVAVFQPIDDMLAEEVTYTNSIPSADITLPTQISGTPLILEQIISYDGAFMEDLSFTEVTNVTAVILYNESDRWIYTADVILAVGGKQLHFFVEELPPRQSVMTLERNKQSYKQQNPTEIVGECKYIREIMDDSVIGEITVDNLLSLTNISLTDVENLQIFYKTVYADGLFYIGGKSHCFTVDKLPAGETIFLEAPYLAGIHSRILRIEYK